MYLSLRIAGPSLPVIVRLAKPAEAISMEVAEIATHLSGGRNAV